jgi:uncharacterized protein YjbJ (UPF0337 family)
MSVKFASKASKSSKSAGVGIVRLVSTDLLNQIRSGCHLVPHVLYSNRVEEKSPIKETQMKASTKDQIQGKWHEAKGKVKEKVGQVTNKPNLEAEGQDEKVAGKIQKKAGQIEKVFEK